jgi:uncharacterized damage-inducible protein DinB
MKEVRRVVDLIASVEHGDPWHGPSTREVLHGVTAEEAAERPIPNAHTIWEIVLHLTVWAREVRRRVLGGEAAIPGEGDWPEAPGPAHPAGAGGAPSAAVPAPSEGAWAASLADLAAAHATLLATLDDFPAGKLDERYGTRRDQPLGAGTTYGAMLYGVALHDAYHTGQIALLKKAMKGT